MGNIIIFKLANSYWEVWDINIWKFINKIWIIIYPQPGEYGRYDYRATHSFNKNHV